MLLFYLNRDTAALYYILFLLTSFLTNGSRKKNGFHMKMKQHTYSEYTCHPLNILLLSCNNTNGI